MTIGAVLFSEMTPSQEWEPEFNSWYDNHHIPIRMQAPGFIGAQRYAARDNAGYLAVYDMEAPETLATPDYRRIKENPSDQTAWMLRNVKGFTRYTGKLLSWQVQGGITDAVLVASPFLYSVFFAVPPVREQEFNDWYVNEHVPLLMGCDEWLGCRRYKIVDGAPDAFTHLAIHHLADLSALDSPARSAARATEWRDRLAQEPWFQGHYSVFSRYGTRFSGTGA